MASVETMNGLEEQLTRFLALGSDADATLSDETAQRLRVIRERCIKSEKEESSDVHGWRRAQPKRERPKQTGHTSGGQHSSTKAPSNWRATQRPAQPYVRYVSKFTNHSVPVEDTILNKVILNKLNKFSTANYEEVKSFLQQILDSDETEFLQEFMKLVFKKASTETTFCPLYARMIAELSSDYTTLQTELETLYTQYIAIFEEITEDACPDYETFLQRNREKTQRKGYSQFLAELTGRGVLKSKDLCRLYTSILTHIQTHAAHAEGKQQLIEEYVDCLLAMTKALAPRSETLRTLRSDVGAICSPLMEDLLARRTTHFPGISSKARFACMDCLDILKST